MNDQLRRTCGGIRRIYNARKAGIEQLREEREQIAQRARDLRSEAEIGRASCRERV